ncbi:MAG: YihY/virulence factor BrkB family protein [Saprospiraceae bacterium]|nr:YihY/virulence factor BrkB family protein [Candidatus Opimibacter iunctus]
MPIKLKSTGTVLKTAFTKWWSRDPFKESSVIAYTAIFSLPGLLVVVVTLSGYFFGPELVTTHIHRNIASVMGLRWQPDSADSFSSGQSLWASLLGLVTILIGATGVFVQLQKSLNIIWEVEARPYKSGLWKLIKLRLFSFGLILSIAFVLLISLVITSFLAAAGDWLKMHWSPTFIWIFNVINILGTLLFITVLFALMFKILPDAKIKWQYVWLGAFITTIFFFKPCLYFGRLRDPDMVAGSI